MDNQRSPRYPAVSLASAIQSVRALWSKEKRTAVQPEVLAKAIGYSGLNGKARMKIASMRQYGLLEKHGAGQRISDLCMRIIHSLEGSEEASKAIQEAALTPDLFRELHDSHAEGSEDTIKSFLILKKGFSDGGARAAAVAYRDTISLANTANGGYNTDEAAPEWEAASISVGDYVQWESQGALQFTEAKRVREISEDGQWAFVEGSNTGLPLKELSVVVEKQPNTSAPGPAQPPRPRTMVEALAAAGTPITPPAGLRQDVFSLTEGPVTIQWPATISKESYEDLGAWLDILKRKIGRSVSDSLALADSVQIEVKPK